MKFSVKSRNNCMRGPTQLSTLLYSQLILRICVATNGLGGGAQTDWVGAPKRTGWGRPNCRCPRARETLDTPLGFWHQYRTTSQISKWFIYPFYFQCKGLPCCSNGLYDV